MITKSYKIVKNQTTLNIFLTYFSWYIFKQIFYKIAPLPYGATISSIKPLLQL